MPITGERRKEYDRQRYLKLKEEKANKLMTKPIHVSIGENLDDPDLLNAIEENIRIREDERQQRRYDIKVRLVDTLMAKGLTNKEALTLANEKSYGKFRNMTLDKLKLYLYDKDEYDRQHLDKLKSEGHII